MKLQNRRSARESRRENRWRRITRYMVTTHSKGCGSTYGGSAPGTGADGRIRELSSREAASGCATEALQVQYRSLQPNFVAVVGQATALDVQVTDGCGNLVGPGGQSAQVSAYFSDNDTAVGMTHIGNGIWQGTWRPVNASGAVVLRVTALLQQGGNLVGGVSAALSGVVNAPAPAATTPTVTAQGVVQAASRVDRRSATPNWFQQTISVLLS